MLAPKGENVYAEACGSKRQVTVLITMRADGKLMRPVVVYPYKRSVLQHITDRMPPHYAVAGNDSGWMNSEIFFEYLANIFIPDLNQ